VAASVRDTLPLLLLLLLVAMVIFVDDWHGT
jgi:hypothetical protein